jgi:hypothetical protein
MTTTQTDTQTANAADLARIEELVKIAQGNNLHGYQNWMRENLYEIESIGKAMIERK